MIVLLCSTSMPQCLPQRLTLWLPAYLSTCLLLCLFSNFPTCRCVQQSTSMPASETNWLSSSLSVHSCIFAFFQISYLPLCPTSLPQCLPQRLIGFLPSSAHACIFAFFQFSYLPLCPTSKGGHKDVNSLTVTVDS